MSWVCCREELVQVFFGLIALLWIADTSWITSASRLPATKIKTMHASPPVCCWADISMHTTGATDTSNTHDVPGARSSSRPSHAPLDHGPAPMHLASDLRTARRL
ncbi:uncharacterized protein PHACADRAFT_206290 [Phanerochaete carnosa HHB-10118-sp]|uniref:Uncharacterized protein n=1 Tax=Phanerochaete carnosa (strain HHB-10118-sp) TaxID=650164 RepID=K5VB31_PHACS|nr:uncharacterized protein PHACADRAFT_206290 [Phanerochaete carnosa HHB-10118-sp]EKM60091.1 hypothetical protein PHACADRAFT_206290 [Phanerochaete carnosa HHB-10118-sp]